LEAQSRSIAEVFTKKLACPPLCEAAIARYRPFHTLWDRS